MIADAESAGRVSELMLDISARPEQSLFPVRERRSAEEFESYRRAVGRIMGEILLEVLNPLYRKHPALKLPELD